MKCCKVNENNDSGLKAHKKKIPQLSYVATTIYNCMIQS
jgi:hypothetical protein